MTDADPEAEKDEKDEEARLLRDVLDWMPSDVLKDAAEDAEEYKILASIDARLDRTIVEHGGEAEGSDQEGQDPEQDLAGPEEPLEAGEEEPPAPPVSDGPEDDRHPTVSTIRVEGIDDDEPEEDPGTVDIVVAESGEDEREEPPEEPEQEPGHVEVVVAEDPDEPETEPLTEDALVQERQHAPPGPTNGQGEPGPWDDLSGFTVVAPPTGGVEGDWIVPGEEQISHGELDQLSAELDTDLEMPGLEEDEPEAWPEADGLEEDLEEPEWPEGDEDEDLLEDDLLEEDALAEAEPEQDELDDDDEGLWSDDDEEDDEFWENLLEDPEDDAPEFEAEEDWDTQEAEAAEQAPAQEALKAETVEDEEEDPFADLWEPEDEPPGTPIEAEQEPARAEVAQEETSEDLWEEEDEEELEFEEVEFTLADPEPEPEPPEEEPTAEPLEAEAPQEEADRGVETTEEEQVAWPGEEDAAEDPEPFEEELWDEEEAEAAEAEPEQEPESQAAVEEEAPELDESADGGQAYTHGPYTLYHKVVETGDGDTRDLYFFARTAPEDASPSDLPDGYEVGVNERTGVPFVRQTRD